MLPLSRFLGRLLDEFFELGQLFRKLCEGIPILLVGLGGLSKAFLACSIFLELATLVCVVCLVWPVVLLSQLTKFVRRSLFLRDAIGRGTHTFTLA